MSLCRNVYRFWYATLQSPTDVSVEWIVRRQGIQVRWQTDDTVRLALAPLHQTVSESSHD